MFLDENYLVLDFETTAIEFGSPHNLANRILLACWTFKGKRYACRAGENGQRLLLRHISEASFVVAHNAKFELGWLKRCGLDLRSVIVWDTMLAEWVLCGNLRPGFSLAAVSSRRLKNQAKDVVGDWIRSGVEPENIPISWLEEYCHQDVALTEAIFKDQLREAKERSQVHLVYQRGLVCACLTDVEFNGLHLDKKAVNDEYDKVLSEYIEAKKELEEFKTEEGKFINWRSPKQVAELLYDQLKFKEPTDFRGNPLRTTGGSRCANKEAISRLVPHTAKQKRLIEQLKKVANLNAKLVKSLEFFKGVCDKYDGTFYGQFNQATTQTHRLSSSGRPIELLSESNEASKKSAQFQNIPREYKKLFIPKHEGYVNVECDGAAIEFRIAAEIGNDEVAKAEIRAGIDIHSITARTLTEAGEPTERQAAKSRTFRPLVNRGFESKDSSNNYVNSVKLS